MSPSQIFNEIVGRLVLRLGLARVAAYLCAREVLELLPDGSRRRPPADDRPKLVVLSLTPFKFRGDLDALAKMPDIRLLEMPHAWQIRMFFNFYPPGTKSNSIFRPERDRKTAEAQNRYRSFLREFLRAFYRRLNVACVITADVRYREDIDIGVISKELNVPYLVFHRECMLASKTLYERVLQRHSDWGRFPGSAVIVHNEVSRLNFVDSGFVEPERVEILGSARMDRFLKRIQDEGRRPAAKGLVVFFSFIHEQFHYPQSVFDQAHVAAARVAQRNPQVEVVVKPKVEIVNKTSWQQAYDNALKAAGIDPAGLPNLKVLPSANAQDLILKASVVCAINSTTLLEAGVAGVPVVVPCFSEIQTGEFRDLVNFRDDLDIFDVPADADEMVAMIERRVAESAVDGELLRKRQALFERYVTPVGGGATERYRETIRRHVKVAGAPFAPSAALSEPGAIGGGAPAATTTS